VNVHGNARGARSVKGRIRERELGVDFGDIFNGYVLHSPINNSMSGWPDRFIQLPNSRIIPCELKVLDITFGGKHFRLNELRQSQAVWLSKWQRAGGKCFLLLGMNEKECLTGYTIFTLTEWKDWLTINIKQLDVTEYPMFTEYDEIRNWFKGFAG
jgi:hypothetical protein